MQGPARTLNAPIRQGHSGLDPNRKPELFMTTRDLTRAALAAAFLFAACAAQAAVLHDDNFTDGPNTTDYRGVGTFDVTTTEAAPRTAAISFILFGARSVDGLNGWDDVYSFALNGVTLFTASFNLGGGGDNAVL
jgi:hypothetical protein